LPDRRRGAIHSSAAMDRTVAPHTRGGRY
jgi:hypothetical protein